MRRFQEESAAYNKQKVYHEKLCYHRVYETSWFHLPVPIKTRYVLNYKGNINMYLHFVSFLHIDTTEIVDILPQIRQEPTYST